MYFRKKDKENPHRISSGDKTLFESYIYPPPTLALRGGGILRTWIKEKGKKKQPGLPGCLV